MSANAVKLPGDLIAEVRAEAGAMGRSIAAQVQHWVRLGQAMEKTPGMSHERIQAALSGKLDPEALNDAEMDDLIYNMSVQPAPGEREWHEHNRLQGGAVGLNDDGVLVRSLPDGGEEVIAEDSA